MVHLDDSRCEATLVGPADQRSDLLKWLCKLIALEKHTDSHRKAGNDTLPLPVACRGDSVFAGVWAWIQFLPDTVIGVETRWLRKTTRFS